MTDNEKLARWQGYKPGTNMYGVAISDSYIFGNKISNLPDYLNDDSAAMSLLDTLVEKDYSVSMSTHGPDWQIGIARSDCDLDYCFGACKPTRREAVVAAVIELINEAINNGR